MDKGGRMSCNSWTGVTLTVFGKEHYDELAKWAKRHPVRLVDDICGCLVVSWEWTYGWFDRNMDELRKMLEDLHVPCEKWEAEVSYRYYDEPETDGSYVDFRIVGGKAVDWKESRMVMVDCEPQYEFDLKGE